MVAEKPDLTFGRFHFRCNFQTVRNLQKGTTKISSGGPKMVERSYGVFENGRKSQKSDDKTVQPPSGSPVRSRLVRRRLVVKFYGRHRPMVAHLMVRRVYSNSGRWCLVWFNLPRRANGQNYPTFGSTSFGELLKGFGVQNGVLGARVSFGIQSYVYIGPGVTFR